MKEKSVTEKGKRCPKSKREQLLIYVSSLGNIVRSLDKKDSREMFTIPDSIYCHLHLKYLMIPPMEGFCSFPLNKPKMWIQAMIRPATNLMPAPIGKCCAVRKLSLLSTWIQKLNVITKFSTYLMRRPLPQDHTLAIRQPYSLGAEVRGGSEHSSINISIICSAFSDKLGFAESWCLTT